MSLPPCPVLASAAPSYVALPCPPRRRGGGGFVRPIRLAQHHTHHKRGRGGPKTRSRDTLSCASPPPRARPLPHTQHYERGFRRVAFEICRGGDVTNLDHCRLRVSHQVVVAFCIFLTTNGIYNTVAPHFARAFQAPCFFTLRSLIRSTHPPLLSPLLSREERFVIDSFPRRISCPKAKRKLNAQDKQELLHSY